MDQERRQSARVATRQSVVFGDYAAIGPPHSGAVTDMSSTGFRIVTSFPERPGATIQIEINRDARDPGSVSLFRGRVVRVQPLGNGESAMGIRIEPRGPRPTFAAGGEGLDGRLKRPGSRRDLGARSVPSGRSRPVEPISATFQAVAAAPRRAPYGRWAVFFAAVALLLYVLLTVVQDILVSF